MVEQAGISDGRESGARPFLVPALVEYAKRNQ